MGSVEPRPPLLPPVGHRLLPQVLDQLAVHHPDRIYASYPLSQNLEDGFVHVSAKTLSHAVDTVAFWIEERLGRSTSFTTLCYIGLADIRYTIVFLAAIKTGWKLLLISPRNQLAQNVGLLERCSCKVLLFSERMEVLVDALTRASEAQTYQVPSLESLIFPTQKSEHYPYKRLFSAAMHDPILLLHSSGSTGDPKMVTLTHGFFSVIDNACNVPVPAGRRAQNSSLFNFGRDGGAFYAPFPPYHLAGVHSYVTIPIFSLAASLVCGPMQVLPSGGLVSQLIRLQRVRALYLPPSIIEQWMAEPDALEQASTLDFVIFGGGPLPIALGDRLEKRTQLCQTYGSLETSGVQLLVPKPGEWSYLEFNPFEKYDMQEYGDGMYELVLHQSPEVSWMRALSHSFPDVETWRTGDLFTRHPTHPGLWRFCSRVDDLIVMSSGFKLRPIPLELLIQESEWVKSALIVGQGQTEPILIIEPSDVGYAASSEELYQNLETAIAKANLIAPTYAQISRRRTIIASPSKPFVRAPKGTIVRRSTTQLYAEEIDVICTADSSEGQSQPVTSRPGAKLDREEIATLIRQLIRQTAAVDESVDFTADENFFMLGMDSLKLARFVHSLRSELGPHDNTGHDGGISLRLVLRYATVRSLTDAIQKLYHTTERIDERPVHDIETMKQLTHANTTSFTKQPLALLPAPSNGVHVLILGPRGSLGPNIVRSFLRSPRVSKVHCLNRGDDGHAQLEAIFASRGFGAEFDPTRLAFHNINLARPRLGLAPAAWDELAASVHIVVHNAWKVDFALPLASFEADYIHSVRVLLELCNASANTARFVFCSSISSVQDWANVHPGVKVPETPLPDNDWLVSSPLGYGQSKQVAERILAGVSSAFNVPVSILRIGQVASPIAQGEHTWPETEWIPALARMSSMLRLMPVDLPDMDWLLSDALGDIIAELALGRAERSEADQRGPEQQREDDAQQEADKAPLLEVRNLVNPHKVSPMQLLDVIRARTGKDIRAASLREFVDAMRASGADQAPLAEEEEEDPEASVRRTMVRMLPWFQHLLDTVAAGRVIQPDFDTEAAAGASATMGRVGAITKEQLAFWCSQWRI